jgi:hypothetical protein
MRAKYLHSDDDEDAGYLGFPTKTLPFSACEAAY